MNRPVPNSASLVIRDAQSTDDLAELRDVLTRAHSAGAAVTVVYAPTSVTHHHAAPAVVATTPAAQPYAAPAGHPGIDVDLTCYGSGGYAALPTNLAPLPAVGESRTVAPLVLLLSTWAGGGSAVAVALTSGNPYAVAALVLAFFGAGGSLAALHRHDSRP
ncbi:hypothetical protein [Actinospica robiniae]|uniref:hypothetical protein n=1 Tax=Actinospica robiniae TaxID=304901 RepID=UPI00040714A4|nr:hypothetical protein [Actinospica robiniae]